MAISVVSVNISTEKGTIKNPVSEIIITEKGILGDAHAGEWHRQISLLAKESIEKWRTRANRKVNFGEFAENITTEGIVLYKNTPGDRLHIGDVVLEITQIGKKCHAKGCAVFNEVGSCVMPKEGIFTKVIRTGNITAGDEIKLVKSEK